MLDDREALYGGAAGGGKTATLIMGGLQYIDVPEYSGILLRRTYPQLLGAKGIIVTLKTWCAPFLKSGQMAWDAGNKMLRSKEGGALKVSSLQHDASVDDLQGQEYQYEGADELTQFSEYQIDELTSRLRRPAFSKIPFRFRGASNPHRQGRGWVKDRYVNGDVGAFVAARMEDNPYLDQEYHAQLSRLDPVRRAQLRDGDWDAAAMTGMYRPEWFSIIKAPPDAVKAVRFWDLAATAEKEGTDPDFTSGTWGGMTAQGTFGFAPSQFRGTPAEVEARIRQQAEIDGKKVPIWIEIEPGASGKSIVSHYQRHILAGWEVHGAPKRKETELLIGPLAAAAQAGHVSLIEGPHTKQFLEDWEMFPDGDHDDMIVSMIGAHEKLARGTNADSWLEFYRMKAQGG